MKKIHNFFDENMAKKIPLLDSPKWDQKSFKLTSKINGCSHIEQKENFSNYISLIPSKFQRPSEEITSRTTDQLNDNKLNFVANFTKKNNFMDMEERVNLSSSKTLDQKKERAWMVRIKNEKVHSGVFQKRAEEKKQSPDKKKFVREFLKRSEERSATILDNCKSSENRLLSSLNRQDNNLT